MKKTDQNLYLLYRFDDSRASDFENDLFAYHIILFFNEMGELSLGDYKSLRPEIVSLDELRFKTKEEMLQFAYGILDALNFHSIFLLAANDYNIGIESCHDLGSFRQIFNRYGHELTRNAADSGKGLFGKLF